MVGKRTKISRQTPQVGQDSVTVSQAASRLGLSVDTIRRRCAAGTLPSFRTAGGHIRIPAEAVEAERRPRQSTASDPASSGGPSPILRSMEEQAKTLDLEARIVGAKRALRRAKREDAEEEAALVEVEEAPRRAREARERQIEQADARRK